jgi:hypothetical protein
MPLPRLPQKDINAGLLTNPNEKKFQQMGILSASQIKIEPENPTTPKETFYTESHYRPGYTLYRGAGYMKGKIEDLGDYMKIRMDKLSTGLKSLYKRKCYGDDQPSSLAMSPEFQAYKEKRCFC